MTIWERWLQHPKTVWLRRAVFQVHLWSGLGVGLYVVVISLSGSVLVYRSELRQTFNPEPRFVIASGDRMSAEALTDTALRAYPGYRVSIFTEPEDPTQAVTFMVDRDGNRQQMFFDPYTGEDLGNALPLGWRLTTWLLDLHDNLLYGDTGRSVNGIGAVLLTLLSLTGAFIWWPGIQSWRRSLTIDGKANWETVHMDPPQRLRVLDPRLHLHVGCHRYLSLVSRAVHGSGRLPGAVRRDQLRATCGRYRAVLARLPPLRPVRGLAHQAPVGPDRTGPPGHVHHRRADVVESRGPASGPTFAPVSALGHL